MSEKINYREITGGKCQTPAIGGGICGRKVYGNSILCGKCTDNRPIKPVKKSSIKRYL